MSPSAVKAERLKMTSYFSQEEFACKCGCEADNISPELVVRLNAARHAANTPFTITSGLRCVTHNASSGGSPSSSHLNGTAVDIKCTSSKQRYTIIQALLDAGFNRIGIAKSFIHVDIDPSKPTGVVWTYG